MHPARIIRCLTLVLLMLTPLIGCQSAAKPKAKAEMPALVFADKYALFIARYQFDQALAVSTPQNARLINNEIKPFLQKLSKQNGTKRLSFKEVQFLSAYLVDGNEGHLIVMEALIPSPLLKNGERVMLNYEVRRKGSGFEVVTSHIRLYNGQQP
ncbi:MAG: hypothetical protein ACM3NT_02980 [Methylocystaceae bacterium]